MIESSSLFSHPEYLRRKAEPVSESEITSKEMRKLVAAMIDFGRDIQALGMSPHNISDVDLPSVAVLFSDENGVRDYDAPQVFFNPESRSSDVAERPAHEACASLFLINAEAPEDLVRLVCRTIRARSLAFTSHNQEGEPQKAVLHQRHASVLGHELDHLQGRVISDFALEDPRCESSLVLFSTEQGYRFQWSQLDGLDQPGAVPLDFMSTAAETTDLIHGRIEAEDLYGKYFDLIKREKLMVPTKDGLVPLKQF